MTLLMKNFRKFLNATYVFDSPGVTLITGRSGQGKSSICMAIIFVLSGIGKKLVYYGKTTCSCTLLIPCDFRNSTWLEASQWSSSCAGNNLELKMASIKITRTKHPNRLIVEKSFLSGEIVILEDKEAQVYVDNLFGTRSNNDHKDIKSLPAAGGIIGYISQRADHTFLGMSPLDKLNFIQDLAFGINLNPDVINKICKTIVKDRENQLNKIVSQKQGIQSVLDNMNIARPQKNELFNDNNEVAEDEAADIKCLETRVLQTQKTLDTLKISLDRAQEQEKNRVKTIKELNSVNLTLNNYGILSKRGVTGGGASLAGKDSKGDVFVICNLTTVDEVDNELKTLITEQQAWKCYRNACAERDRIDESFNKVQITKRTSYENIALEKHELICIINTCKEIIKLPRLSDLHNDLSEIQKKINAAKTLLTCPQCKKEVILWGEQLFNIHDEKILGLTKSEEPLLDSSKAVSVSSVSSSGDRTFLGLQKGNELKYKITSMSEIKHLETQQTQIKKNIEEHQTKIDQVITLCSAFGGGREAPGGGVKDPLDTSSKTEGSRPSPSKMVDGTYSHNTNGSLFSKIIPSDASRLMAAAERLPPAAAAPAVLPSSALRSMAPTGALPPLVQTDNKKEFDIQQCLKISSSRLDEIDVLYQYYTKFTSNQELCKKLKVSKPRRYYIPDEYKTDLECYQCLINSSLQKEQKASDILKQIVDPENVLKVQREALCKKRNLEQMIEKNPDLSEKIQLYKSQIFETQTLVKSLKNQIDKLVASQQWEKVVDLEKQEKEFHQSIPRAVKLQEIIKISAAKAIQQLIDEINLITEIYLDQFLDDVVVTLVCNNNKIVVEVLQGGNKTDLNSLSGGEYARVVIAFTMAIAEINNSKLLIIDEGTASLDQETSNHVVHVIKNIFKGNIIMVAHQTTTGIFDKVIDLD